MSKRKGPNGPQNHRGSIGPKGSKGPAQKDWHLWGEVKRTISPLSQGAKKASIAPLKSELEDLLKVSAEPDQAPDPKNFGHARDGGRLFRNQSVGSVGVAPVWPPTATTFTQAHQKKHPNQSIEPKMRRRVRRGRVPIDGRIDLHGMRQHEAHAALHRFIAARIAKGDRTLLVITGKGLKKTDPTNVFERGVLRHMLPRWLNEPDLAPLIAGYEVSAQHHGGEGAYYVRLKRPRG